ncbi:MAG: hypothetical protein NTV29_18850 [Planctomycetota bacterium]|nr:hypothetical protein [Planctomycetota bacterium]
MTFIAFRSNTSPTHLILRDRWRDFIAMLGISGVSESSTEYNQSVDYEHEHRPPRRTEHEHDEEPEQSDAGEGLDRPFLTCVESTP